MENNEQEQPLSGLENTKQAAMNLLGTLKIPLIFFAVGFATSMYVGRKRRNRIAP